MKCDCVQSVGSGPDGREESDPSCTLCGGSGYKPEWLVRLENKAARVDSLQASYEKTLLHWRREYDAQRVRIAELETALAEARKDTARHDAEVAAKALEQLAAKYTEYTARPIRAEAERIRKGTQQAATCPNCERPAHAPGKCEVERGDKHVDGIMQAMGPCCCGVKP